jgi:4-hydroxy 2-oxovalerate aldolase
MLGLGRGSGNCPTELLLAFLKNPKFDLRPVFEVIEKYMLPLQNDIRWGYYIPYMITGMMNEHPKSGLKLVDSEQRNEVVKFYDAIMDGKVLE